MLEALDALPPSILSALAALAAVPAVVSLFYESGAAALARIPVAGPILARLWRSLSPRLVTWWRDQVTAAAERAVAEAEAVVPAGELGADSMKLDAARASLDRAAPGLTTEERDSEIEAALQRLKGSARLERRAVAE